MPFASELTTVGVPIVFLAGLASFLSPCVLPLVPGYLAYMSGVQDLADEGKTSIRRLLPPTVSFVVGFTIVFMGLGLALSALGSFLISNQVVLTRISGILIVFMGLVFLGVVPIPWLYSERRFHVGRPATIGGSLLMGIAFAFGWTPCIGPALGAALGLAAVESTPGRGALLLLSYSAGLGIPFIASALGASRLVGAIEKIRRRQQLILRISGGLLVAVGLLFVFNRVFVVSRFIQQAMENLGLNFWTSL